MIRLKRWDGFGFWIFLALPSLMFAFLSIPSATSHSSKMGWSLGDFSKTPVQPIFIILSEQVDLKSFRQIQGSGERHRAIHQALLSTAQRSQMSLIDRLSGRFHFQRFYIHNMIAVHDATPQLITELAARPDVKRIIANKTFQVLEPRYQFHFERPSGVNDSISATGAVKVWQKLRVNGRGIVVAGQDTGVEWNHPALIRQYRGSANGLIDHNYNWHDAIRGSGDNPCGYDSKVPCDDDAHGTHTMGTIIGSDLSGRKIGMAPGAQWIACRNMDMGMGTPARYLECFEYFFAPYPAGTNPFDGRSDPTKAPHIINNSWGCDPAEGCEGAELLPVMTALKEAGIMVVASAGNSGPRCSSIEEQPPHHSHVTLSVGAYDHRRGEIASFSSRGPSAFDGQIGPDVVAPGVSILSSVPGGQYAKNGWDGTSMAGPHVVGLVALMWSANPKLIGKIEETTEIIRKSAIPKTTVESCGGVDGSMVPNNTYGHGFIDAYTAVQAALRFN